MDTMRNLNPVKHDKLPCLDNHHNPDMAYGDETLTKSEKKRKPRRHFCAEAGTTLPRENCHVSRPNARSKGQQTMWNNNGCAECNDKLPAPVCMADSNKSQESTYTTNCALPRAFFSSHHRITKYFPPEKLRRERRSKIAQQAAPPARIRWLP